MLSVLGGALQDIPAIYQGMQYIPAICCVDSTYKSSIFLRWVARSSPGLDEPSALIALVVCAIFGCVFCASVRSIPVIVAIFDLTCLGRKRGLGRNFQSVRYHSRFIM